MREKKLPDSSTPPSNPKAADVIRQAAERWPAGYVPRNQVKEFTGGLYSGGYLANRDSIGDGPEGRFLIGRQTVYPTDSLVQWLVARIGGVKS